MTNYEILALIQRALILAALAAILGILISARLVTFDHYFGAYGVSAGTDTHYCSLVIAPVPSFACESAR